MPGPTHLKLTGSFNSSLSSSLLIRRLSKFNDDIIMIIMISRISASNYLRRHFPRVKWRHNPTYYKRIRRSAGEWVNQIPNIESLLVINLLHMRQTTVLCEGSRQDRATHLVQNSCEGFSLDTAFSSAFTCRGKSPEVNNKITTSWVVLDGFQILWHKRKMNWENVITLLLCSLKTVTGCLKIEAVCLIGATRL